MVVLTETCVSAGCTAVVPNGSAAFDVTDNRREGLMEGLVFSEEFGDGVSREEPFVD